MLHDLEGKPSAAAEIAFAVDSGGGCHRLVTHGAGVVVTSLGGGGTEAHQFDNNK